METNTNTLIDAAEITLTTNFAWEAAQEAYRLNNNGMRQVDICEQIQQKKTIVSEWISAERLALVLETRIPNVREQAGVHKVKQIALYWKKVPDSIKETKTVFDFFLECNDRKPKSVLKELIEQITE